jgi:hypothetical protein
MACKKYPPADIKVKPHILANAILSTKLREWLLLKTASTKIRGIPIIKFHILKGPGDVDT